MRRSTDLERVYFGGDIPPGTLINFWVRKNSAFIRSIDPNHMVRGPPCRTRAPVMLFMHC